MRVHHRPQRPGGPTIVALRVGLGLLCLGGFIHSVIAQSPRLTEALLDGFKYRNLGPYRAGSWISDIAVPDAPAKSHLYTFYVAVRYGGRLEDHQQRDDVRAGLRTGQ